MGPQSTEATAAQARPPRARGPPEHRASACTECRGKAFQRSDAVRRPRLRRAGRPPAASLAPPTDRQVQPSTPRCWRSASRKVPSVAACRVRHPGALAPGTHLREGGVCTQPACVSDASEAPGVGWGREQLGYRAWVSPEPRLPWRLRPCPPVPSPFSGTAPWEAASQLAGHAGLYAPRLCHA